MTGVQPENPPFRRVLRDPVLLLAFGFGSGCLKPAPGTWGTAAGVPLALLVTAVPLPLGLLLVALALVGGIGLCELAARRLAVHDHPGIVWDEMAAFAALALVLPPSVAGWLSGFVLFRLFDALKPWPISYFDRTVAGGFGIMFDDVLAALAAALVVWATGFVVPWLVS